MRSRSARMPRRIKARSGTSAPAARSMAWQAAQAWPTVVSRCRSGPFGDFLDALADVAQPLFQVQHLFVHRQKAEMAGLDDAGMDRPHRNFIDAAALRGLEGIAVVGRRLIRRMAGRGKGFSARETDPAARLSGEARGGIQRDVVLLERGEQALDGVDSWLPRALSLVKLGQGTHSGELPAMAWAA